MVAGQAVPEGQQRLLLARAQAEDYVRALFSSVRTVELRLAEAGRVATEFDVPCSSLLQSFSRVRGVAKSE